MSAPTITFVGDEATITCEARIGAWSALRLVALDAECSCRERRVGLITKRFSFKGDEAQLQKFINLAWYHPDLRKSFREELSRERP